jgi:hypothetical protein
VAWALLSDALPIYPLYALLFADAGLSGARISALFVVWSVTAFACEVPAGVLADRWSRRGCLAAAGAGQAAAYATWVRAPGFAGFAVGFVLWGASSTLVSGALEALIYDGLAACGAAERFAVVYGRVTAAGLVGQLPAGLAAAPLFHLGGYPLVGWASVAACLAAALLALTVPEPTRSAPSDETGSLRAAWSDLRANPALRRAVLVVAAVAGLDAVEEYFGLLARSWGVPTAAVPVVLLVVPLAGAAGAALASRRRGSVAWPLAAASALFLAANALGRPVAVAVLAVAYALYRAAVVLAQADLQRQIAGGARATVTSIAALAEEAPVLAVYAAWALGGLTGVALLAIGMTLGAWRMRPARQRIMAS